MDKLYIECDCNQDEHRLVFNLDKSDKTIYLHYFLSSYTFFGRLKKSIKYLFGYKCIYGHFGETVLEKEKVMILQKALTELLEEA